VPWPKLHVTPGWKNDAVDQLGQRLLETLASGDLPPIFTTPWLWPIAALLLLGGVITDGRVNWEGEHRHRPDLGDGLLGALLVISGVASLATDAMLPLGDSLVWPVGVVMMAAACALRWQATDVLGADFNAALRTRPGQQVRNAGPYRWVRHPGYTGVLMYLTGLVVIFGWWPPIVVMVVVLGNAFRERVEREEAINRREIEGYERYMREVQWRMIPGLW
jgi:protein-S-isoprenylcysteine O-methyltransferase Ste14